MKFISFKAKYYICYKIVQFCSIFLCIPISIYPFLTKRLFWHPLNLNWYQKISQSYKICYDKNLYPSSETQWISLQIFFSLFGAIIAIINLMLYNFYFIIILLILIIYLNTNIYKNAIFYKNHKHEYEILNKSHKL